MIPLKWSKRKYAETNETVEDVDETTYNAPTEETSFIQEQVSFKLIPLKILYFLINKASTTTPI